MYTDPLLHRVFNEPKPRLTTVATMIAASLLTWTAVAHAQPQATLPQPQNSKPTAITMRLEPDQIGTVKTGEKISTRLSFREPVKEVVCGDLYDPASGTGSFVIQRIDRDVFIKPIVAKGFSNMFVKIGAAGEHIYNFYLVIVPYDQAYMIVKVLDAPPTINSLKSGAGQSRLKLLPVPVKFDLADETASAAPGRSADGPSVQLTDYTGLGESPPPLGVASTARVLARREPIRRVIPDYPELARSSHKFGDVVVQLEIGREGKVKSARAISGPLMLRNSAVTASRSWRFAPLKADQQAPSLFTITYRFRDPESLN